jgi:hypothetical protein
MAGQFKYLGITEENLMESFNTSPGSGIKSLAEQVTDKLRVERDLSKFDSIAFGTNAFLAPAPLFEGSDTARYQVIVINKDRLPIHTNFVLGHSRDEFNLTDHMLNKFSLPQLKTQVQELAKQRFASEKIKTFEKQMSNQARTDGSLRYEDYVNNFKKIAEAEGEYVEAALATFQQKVMEARAKYNQMGRISGFTASPSPLEDGSGITIDGKVIGGAQALQYDRSAGR